MVNVTVADTNERPVEPAEIRWEGPDELRPLLVPIGSLVPLPGNPRRGDIEAVARSLERFGQRKPTTSRTSDNVVTAGNHTRYAALSLGWTHLANVGVDDDDVTSKAWAVADNRTSDLATNDEADLAAMLAEINALDASLMTAAGYSDNDLAELLASLEPPFVPQSDPDEVPEPPAVPVTQVGDLWILGRHRLACLDSTEGGGIGSLLEGRQPAVVFTDPPYGIGYQAMRGSRPIGSDKSPALAEAVTVQALRLAGDPDAVFVCCDWRSLATFTAVLDVLGWEPKACIVWDKKTRVQNLDRYAKQHELILYSGPYGGQPTVDVDVWTIHRDFAAATHATPKPVELVERALLTASLVGDHVYDPFAGSGPTLLAAERTGRTATLVEMDPAYCDVIVERWERHTGEKAHREQAPA